MYVKGKFTNADGLELHSEFFEVPKSCEVAVEEAMRASFRHSFLALASDRRDYVRLVNVEKLYRKIPAHQLPVGQLIIICSSKDGEPLPMTSFVHWIPKSIRDQQLTLLVEKLVLDAKPKKRLPQ